MAERRMFTKKITDADEFISLPSSTQALYLHLTMSADDDGFNNQIQMAMFKAHASVDDLKIRLAKRFIIQFSNGVIVIKHWRMANALRKDRYTVTAYQEELKMLKIKDNGSYSLENEDVVAEWLPDGCQTVAACKDSIGNDSVDKNKENNNIPPTPLKGGAEKKKTPRKKVVVLLGEILKTNPNALTEKVIAAMYEWAEYKDQRNSRYVEAGLSQQLNLAYNYTKRCGEDAVVDCIHKSIANNYQGITWDKLDHMPKSGNKVMTTQEKSMANLKKWLEEMNNDEQTDIQDH